MNLLSAALEGAVVALLGFGIYTSIGSLIKTIKRIRALKFAKPGTPTPLVHPCTSYHVFEPLATCRLEGPNLAHQHTALLSRCRICKQCKTEAFYGDFTLADFTMPSAEGLERMVRG